jgi:hypothetical protein
MDDSASENQRIDMIREIPKGFTGAFGAQAKYQKSATA